MSESTFLIGLLVFMAIIILYDLSVNKRN